MLAQIEEHLAKHPADRIKVSHALQDYSMVEAQPTKLIPKGTLGELTLPQLRDDILRHLVSSSNVLTRVKSRTIAFHMIEFGTGWQRTCRVGGDVALVIFHMNESQHERHLRLNGLKFTLKGAKGNSNLHKKLYPSSGSADKEQC